MSKKEKVNINRIETEGFDPKDKQEIEKGIERLNSIDGLFTLVMVLMLSVIFINRYFNTDYVIIITSIVMIAAVIYIRIARKDSKKRIESVLNKQSKDKKISVMNNDEKLHAIAMYFLLIAAFFALVNAVLNILFF